MTCEESIKWLDSLIKTLGQSQYQSLWNWEQPLTEIKEMLESKRVVELPCKVGDTVYIIDPFNGICDTTLRNVRVNNVLKNNIFLTKSEAEQKLKELLGDN